MLFINENIGGHATVHHHLRSVLADRSDIEPVFLDLAPPSLAARVAGAAVPGLARLDLDLQPLRAQLVRSAGLARSLERHLSGIDVVHLYTHNAGLLSADSWRRHPTVVSLDTTNAQNGYRLPSRRPTSFTRLTVAATMPFERRVYQAADLVVANSRWAAGSLRDDYHLADEKLRILPFGIDGPPFGPGAAPGVTAAGRPRAVFVGRSLARKGGLQLLRVHRQHLADRLDLALVTQERPETGPGVEVIGDLQPGDPRLWDILRRSAMFVFPSEIDMAPNAVLEAMMAGLPIVARPVGAIPEMVDHGVNGLLVGPEAADLVGAVTALLDDEPRRVALGASSRARALAHYDASTNADQLVAILAEAHDRHHRRPAGRR
ncbi:MAG: glycosyltransferase family 4 protein [Acidimicrobiales bacterium]